MSYKNLYRRPLHIGSSAWHRGVAASSNGFSVRHQALDIAAARYTGVYSIRSGTVVAKGYDLAHGHWVRIQHAHGVTSFYAHLNEASPLRIGQKVSLWGKIGRVGKTGNATGYHLHFGVSVHGHAVDPAVWLMKH